MQPYLREEQEERSVAVEAGMVGDEKIQVAASSREVDMNPLGMIRTMQRSLAAH